MNFNDFQTKQFSKTNSTQFLIFKSENTRNLLEKACDLFASIKPHKETESPFFIEEDYLTKPVKLIYISNWKWREDEDEKFKKGQSAECHGFDTEEEALSHIEGTQISGEDD